MAGGLRVRGYTELLRAFDHTSKEMKKGLRDELRSAGRIVQTDATSRLARYGRGDAIKLRTVVRRRGVTVESARRKTTGLRPDFGSLQMRRGLLPAVESKQAEVERKIEQTLDRVAAGF